MEMKELIDMYLSKQGLPCAWEAGGGGCSQIICDADGEPKRAVHIRNENSKGKLINSMHALIPISKGDVIIQADIYKDKTKIKVWRIIAINIHGKPAHHYPVLLFEPDGTALLEIIATYDEGQWDNAKIAEKYKKAIEAAVGKAECYSCYKPHYIKEGA